MEITGETCICCGFKAVAIRCRDTQGIADVRRSGSFGHGEVSLTGTAVYTHPNHLICSCIPHACGEYTTGCS